MLEVARRRAWRQRRRLLERHGMQDVHQRRRVKGRAPGEHLVDDGAGGEDVRSMVHGLAAELLGRQILRRADDQALLRQPRVDGFGGTDVARQAEIEQLHAVAREEDVGRLEVPVDQAAFVHRRQRLDDGQRNRRGFVEGKGAAHEAIGERLAIEQLHHEVVHAVLVPDVVDGADVRVVQRGDGARFALEPDAAFRGPSRRRRAGP